MNSERKAADEISPQVPSSLPGGFLGCGSGRGRDEQSELAVGRPKGPQLREQRVSKSSAQTPAGPLVPHLGTDQLLPVRPLSEAKERNAQEGSISNHHSRQSRNSISSEHLEWKMTNCGAVTPDNSERRPKKTQLLPCNFPLIPGGTVPGMQNHPTRAG